MYIPNNDTQKYDTCLIMQLNEPTNKKNKNTDQFLNNENMGASMIIHSLSGLYLSICLSVSLLSNHYINYVCPFVC